MNISRSKTCRGSVRVTLAAALAVVGLGSDFETRSRAGVPAGLLASGLAGQGGYGTIKGRVVWGGSEAPPQKTLVEKGQATKDPAVCASAAAIPDNKLVVDPKTKGVKFAFAYLPKPSGANADAVKAVVAKTPVVVIDQKNCEFIPYVTAVHQNQTVKFKSSDPTNHNIHLTPFTNAAFNSVVPVGGELDMKFVAERRVIPLTCDFHPWMKGWIMVFDHPFFATTGDDGLFEITGVPAGEQKLVVWQEAVGYATPSVPPGITVTVAAGGTTDVGEIKIDPAKVK